MNKELFKELIETKIKLNNNIIKDLGRNYDFTKEEREQNIWGWECRNFELEGILQMLENDDIEHEIKGMKLQSQILHSEVIE